MARRGLNVGVHFSSSMSRDRAGHNSCRVFSRFESSPARHSLSGVKTLLSLVLVALGWTASAQVLVYKHSFSVVTTGASNIVRRAYTGYTVMGIDAQWAPTMLFAEPRTRTYYQSEPFGLKSFLAVGTRGALNYTVL